MSIPFANFIKAPGESPTDILSGASKWSDYVTKQVNIQRQKQIMDQASKLFPAELKSKDLANTYQGLVNDWYDKVQSADINYKNAMASVAPSDIELNYSKAKESGASAQQTAAKIDLIHQAMQLGNVIDSVRSGKISASAALNGVMPQPSAPASALSGTAMVPGQQIGGLTVTGKMAEAYNQQTPTQNFAGTVGGVPMTKDELDKYTQIAQSAPQQTGVQQPMVQQSAGQQQVMQQPGQQPEQTVQTQQPNIPAQTSQSYEDALDDLKIRQDNLMQMAGFPASQEVKGIIAKRTARAREEAKAEYAGERTMGVEQAKDMMKFKDNMSSAAQRASANLTILNEIKSAYDDAFAKGFALNKLASIDSKAQVAIKNTGALLTNQIGILGGLGLGRVLQSQQNALSSSLPRLSTNPQAMHEIIQQLILQQKAFIKQNSLTQKMSGYTKDPSLVKTALANMNDAANTVDEKGVLHPEALNVWDKYATPSHLQAIKNGEQYFPEDLSEQDIPLLSNEAYKAFSSKMRAKYGRS